jgi:hypothetical protein
MSSNEKQRVTDLPDIPAMDFSKGFDYEIALAHRAMLSVISELQTNDPRPYLILMNLISSVPDPAWRIKSLDLLREMYGIIPYTSKEGQIITQMALGNVTDWIQQGRGKVRWNLIGSE